MIFKSSRKPVPTPTKQRSTKYWSEKYPETCAQISKREINLQEAIFELSTGEEDLVQDMNLLRKTYAESLGTILILRKQNFDKFNLFLPHIPYEYFLVVRRG